MRKFLVLFMCFMMLVSTTAFAAEQAFTMTNENGAYDVQQELRIAYGKKINLQVTVVLVTTSVLVAICHHGVISLKHALRVT